MAQQIEQTVKAAYNQLPYPGIDNNSIDPAVNWSWVNVDWIGALMPMALRGDPPFKRILVAGCGTGNEAFQMKNRFPNAEITAVDYSEESINIARNYQNEYQNQASISFEVGDLTVDKGNWVKADYYDFISCHGVISYIPNTQNVFDLFAKCLSKEGICYIGANGATHFGVTLRKSFEYLGYANCKFEDTLETRRLIELFDRLHPYQSHASIYPSTYIDSDILNAFSLNLTLSEWNAFAEKSELHLIGSAELIPSLSKVLSPNILPLLVSKSRKELCELIAINNVTPFHRLLFGKQSPPSIPWSDFEKLIDCEFQTTRLYKLENPASDIYGELIINANITHGCDVNFRWPTDDLLEKLLHQQEGSCKIEDVLENSMEVSKSDLHELTIKLFMFYQLGIIKVFPNLPKAAGNHPSTSTPSKQ